MRGRLGVDYAAAAAGPAHTPVPVVDATAPPLTGVLASTGSDDGLTSVTALIGAAGLIAGLGLALLGGRHRSQS
jgi:hypothetical protein